MPHDCFSDSKIKDPCIAYDLIDQHPDAEPRVPKPVHDNRGLNQTQHQADGHADPVEGHILHQLIDAAHF